ncbi:MAG: VOC family protein [Rubrobacteraceae bacterium]
MGKRSRYEPGTFCWVDLATTDPAGAANFYGALFGWQTEDIAGGEGGTYTMFHLDGEQICALYEIEPGRREQGVPPHWSSYVGVEDVDATSSRARELGGTVLGEPREVLDMGRMAVIADPAGATFASWEPRTWAGAGRVNDPNCFAWNDLQTRDPRAAMDFYSSLFGWEMLPMEENGELAYVVLRNAGLSNGGIMPMDERHGDVPPYWLVYFVVHSCDETVSRTRELGGEVLAEPMEIGAGRISVLKDPQGAVFAIFEGETDE